MTQKYTCRGKKITAKEQRADLEEKRKVIQARIEAMANENEDDAQADVNASVKNSLAAKVKALDNQIEKLADEDDAAVVGRMKCGYDLTAIIEAHPFDNQEYFSKCPACGCEFGFRNVPENEL